MSILDSSLMIGNTGWAEVEEAGSITWNQIDGTRKYVRLTGAGVYNYNGIIRTAGQTAEAGNVIYVDFRSSSVSGIMAVIDDTPGLTQNEGAGWRNDTPNNWYELDDAVIDIPSPPSWSNNVWRNMKFELMPGGSVKTYWHIDDGTPQDRITDWTELCESSSFSWIDKVIYFEINTRSLFETVDFSRFYYTDNGQIKDMKQFPGGGNVYGTSFGHIKGAVPIGTDIVS